MVTIKHITPDTVGFLELAMRRESHQSFAGMNLLDRRSFVDVSLVRSDVGLTKTYQMTAKQFDAINLKNFETCAREALQALKDEGKITKDVTLAVEITDGRKLWKK